MKITVPGSSACLAHSSRAAPASMAVCRSWPQACIAPGIREAYGRPVSSVTGSASMSPRSSNGGHRAESAARADLNRQPVQRGQHLLLGLGQIQADLRLLVDRVPQLGDLTGDVRGLIA